MYNSRPREYNRGFAVPENYSGNAFSDKEESGQEVEIIEPEASGPEKEETKESVATDKDTEDVIEVCSAHRGASRFGFNVGKLFRGGIGFEELLIIALILLIAQSDNNDDVIVLLALLLFIS